MKLNNGPPATITSSLSRSILKTIFNRRLFRLLATACVTPLFISLNTEMKIRFFYNAATSTLLALFSAWKLGSETREECITVRVYGRFLRSRRFLRAKWNFAEYVSEKKSKNSWCQIQRQFVERVVWNFECR